MFFHFPVLIESDWNLKNFNIFIKVSTGLQVLIESDWNLKINISATVMIFSMVLIESD